MCHVTFLKPFSVIVGTTQESPFIFDESNDATVPRSATTPDAERKKNTHVAATLHETQSFTGVTIKNQRQKHGSVTHFYPCSPSRCCLCFLWLFSPICYINYLIHYVFTISFLLESIVFNCFTVKYHHPHFVLCCILFSF